MEVRVQPQAATRVGAGRRARRQRDGVPGAAVAAGFLAYRSTSSLLPASALLLLPAALFGYARFYRDGAEFRSAEALFQEIDSALPAFVLVLKRVG